MFRKLSRKALFPILLLAFSQSALAYDCAKSQGGMAFAAHAGHLDVLKKHKQNGCAFRADERGFTLHDFATLSGDTKTQKWLAEQKVDTKASKALIRLIQAGLRQLGHDAGPVDGILSDRTHKAMLAYQKQHKLSQSKNPKAAWVTHFYRDLVRRTQSALIQKGYKIGKADGVLGRDTRKALMDYRHKYNLQPKQYAYLDETIVRHLLSGQSATPRSKKLATSHALANNKAQQKRKSGKSNSKAPQKNNSHKKNTKAPTPVRYVEENPNRHGIRLEQAGEKRARSAPAVAPQHSSQSNAAQQHNNHHAISGRYRTISGKLSIGSQQCTIGGQSIDRSWCQSHSDRNGRSCSAVIDNKGKVYNLLCK